jgi:hypothetical protein
MNACKDKTILGISDPLSVGPYATRLGIRATLKTIVPPM